MIDRFLDNIPIIADVAKKGVEKKNVMDKNEIRRMSMRYYEWYNKWYLIGSGIMCTIASVLNGLLVWYLSVSELDTLIMLTVAVIAVLLTLVILVVYREMYNRWGSAYIITIPEYRKAFYSIMSKISWHSAWYGLVLFASLGVYSTLNNKILQVFSAVGLSFMPMGFIIKKVLCNQNKYLFCYYVYDKNIDLLTGNDDYISAQKSVSIILSDGRKLKINLLKDNFYFLDERILVIDSHKCKTPQLLLPNDYNEIRVKLRSGRVVRYDVV